MSGGSNIQKQQSILLNLAVELESICESFGEITKVRIEEAETDEERQILIQEIRLLNVLTVTCARCAAMSNGMQFGVTHGDLPGALPI